jgi:hypothetical protein
MRYAELQRMLLGSIHIQLKYLKPKLLLSFLKSYKCHVLNSSQSLKVCFEMKTIESG